MCPRRTRTLVPETLPLNERSCIRIFKIWAQRDEAERAIQRLAGVQGATNQIKVEAPSIASQDVRLAIQEALWRRATREANDIDVAGSSTSTRMASSVSTMSQQGCQLLVLGSPWPPHGWCTSS